MKLRWARPALADLIEAQGFIAWDERQIAQEVAQRVWDAASRLCDNPNIGQTWPRFKGTRESVVTHTPDLIVSAVEILRV